MNQQLSIFDARAARDSALSRVESHASREWLEAAFAALRGYLETHEEFFCDDFWTLGVECSGNPKALGVVICRARDAKLMERTDRCRPSKRSNMSPKPLWKSLIFKGTP